MNQVMMFAGPRGDVRIGWETFGYTYASIVIEQWETGMLGGKWVKVWDDPGYEVGHSYIRTALPDTILRLYKEALMRWVRYDAAWSKFHESSAIPVDEIRFKMLPGNR